MQALSCFFREHSSGALVHPGKGILVRPLEGNNGPSIVWISGPAIAKKIML